MGCGNTRSMRAGLLAALLSLAILAGPAGAAEPSTAGAPEAIEPPAVVEPALPAADADRGVRVSSLPSKRVPGPSRKTGTYTARILIGTAIRHRPGGKSVRWYARTRTKWSGNGQRLMVLGSRHVRGKTWLKVRLPIRPNGSSGWIPRDRVQITRSHEYIVIDRSRRMLSLYRRGRVASRFRVVVGASGTPTPLGLFALQDRVRQPDPKGFIGPWAIPLTAHSDALRRYDGGPGLVALHGRSGASLRDPLGSARSHGCVRMNNRRVARITRSLLGTAVRIRN